MKFRLFRRSRVVPPRRMVSLGPLPIRRWSASPHLSEEILTEVRNAGRDEACGLLIGRRVGETIHLNRAVTCPNTEPSHRRATRFMIDPMSVLEVERDVRGTGEEVVGFYHSHPASEPAPSSTDRKFMALWPNTLWLIVGPSREADTYVIRAWTWDQEGASDPVREVSGGTA